MGIVVPFLGPGERRRETPPEPPPPESVYDALKREQRTFQQAWVAFLDSDPPPGLVRNILQHHCLTMESLRDFFWGARGMSRSDIRQLELAGLRRDGGTCDND